MVFSQETNAEDSTLHFEKN